MAFQILSTKLYNPPVKADFVRRPRLVQRLENGYRAGKCVTLVSAPAGFGKTTLINEWIAGSEPRKAFGWISLDDGDNDPARFLTYLVSAIQKVNPEIGRPVLALLQASQGSTLSDLIESLINEISAAPSPFLIVLDDYHLIKNLEVHALMQLFLKRQPKPLHLVIMTREDPPLPLPRMRVQGLVTEIREQDLRFRLSEAQAFLIEAMEIKLSAEEVGKLTERTEGWAAGMQLAALALEELPDEVGRRNFIEDFAGSNRLIVDYLISEVLQRLPEQTKQFLLSTSILERFCAELSDFVVFGEDNAARSQQILEDLEQGNMFLVPLDNQRHWYRYHHLFSEMLFHSFRRSAPDQIPALHRRASQWFETRGFILDAVKHAISYAAGSGVWDFPRGLLDRISMSVLFRGQSSLVIDWCREFPKAYLETAPELCIYYAWALVLTFRTDYLEAVEEKLKLAGRAVEAGGLPAQASIGEDGALVPLREWVIGQMYVIRSQILLGGFLTTVDPQEEIALSLKGLALLPEGENVTRAICKINLAHAQTMQNNPVESEQAFWETMPFMLESQNFLSAATAIFYLARLAYYQGRLEQAEALCREWKGKFAEAAGIAPGDVWNIPATRGLDIVLSLILWERGQMDEAEQTLTQALALLGWASWMELHGFIILAHLLHQRGNAIGAQETLKRMARRGPQHAACSEALQVLFTLRESPDDLQVRARAKGWSEKFTPHPTDRLALGIGPYHSDAEYFCNLAWSRVQIVLGNYQAAASFVGPALKSAKEHGLPFRVVELSIEQALIEQGQGNVPAAFDALEPALKIAEQAGYVRVFDHSPQLDRLLQQAIHHNYHAAYARQVLASARQVLASFPRLDAQVLPLAAVPQKRPGTSRLVEPLSDREIEVLKFLAKGLTPAEVAQRLVLSPNTLKAHTQNIYAKLDVHSRIEAINKARELGII
jgi:LuxR family transcriptional regulator, maltose regulon positive regulatory protein